MKTNTTVSVVTNREYDIPNAILLRKWCDKCAEAGGSFSIVTTYDGKSFGCPITTYTINWPDGVSPLN